MKIAVLLSGGVDSSVALCILKEQGYDVTAFYLKIWLEDELAFLGECPWEEDLEYAKGVCNQLGVRLEIINMQAEYLNTVVEYTITELKSGRTPSPDIMCNRNIKFGQFLDKIDKSYTHIASGHYAQIESKDNLFYLKESPDVIKDQTYFLTYLNQEQLSKIIFPIGKYTKSQVRDLAQKYLLPTSNRKDSQGICFLGKIKYNDFIKFHLGELKGDIIEIESNKKIGTHKGYWFHTIGQRTGLGLSGGPWYVVKKDIPNNIIYISKNNQTEIIPHDKFNVLNVNWIPQKVNDNFMEVKLRHGAKKYKCEVKYISDNKVQVLLSEPDQGLSSGQFAIFYKDSYCLGGGVIEIIE
jgi:tRNA-specific 2-thiouridylase